MAPLLVAAAISIDLWRERVAIEEKLALLADPSHSGGIRQVAPIRTADGGYPRASQGGRTGGSLGERTMRAVHRAAAKLAQDRATESENFRTLPIGYASDQLYYPSLLGDPTYLKAAVTVVTEQIYQRYWRLFATLGLSDDTECALVNLLVEQQMGAPAAKYLSSVASGQQHDGSNPLSIPDKIAALGGPEIARRVESFAGLSGYYAAMDDLEARLRGTSSPLTGVEADGIVRMLAAAIGPRMQRDNWVVPEEVISQARSILRPDQVSALEDIRDEQAARASLAGASP